MSRSTPIAQLPPPDQMGVSDEAAYLAQELQQSALMAAPAPSPAAPAYHHQGAVAPPAAAAPVGLGASPDVKLAVIVLVIFALLSNEPITTMLTERVPGMGNPWVSVAVRAVAAAALVVVLHKVLA